MLITYYWVSPFINNPEFLQDIFVGKRLPTFMQRVSSEKYFGASISTKLEHETRETFDTKTMPLTVAYGIE